MCHGHVGIPETSQNRFGQSWPPYVPHQLVKPKVDNALEVYRVKTRRGQLQVGSYLQAYLVVKLKGAVLVMV